MKKEHIPAAIRRIRQRLGLTHEQFAQRVGVPYSTVNHWVNGKCIPWSFLIKRVVEMKTELDVQDLPASRASRQTGAKGPRKKSPK